MRSKEEIIKELESCKSSAKWSEDTWAYQKELGRIEILEWVLEQEVCDD